MRYSKELSFFNYSTENLGWTCLAVMKIMSQTKYTLNFINVLLILTRNMIQTLTLKVSWDQKINKSALHISHISDFFFFLHLSNMFSMYPPMNRDIHRSQKLRIYGFLNWVLSPDPKSHQRSDAKHNESILQVFFLKGKSPTISIF